MKYKIIMVLIVLGLSLLSGCIGNPDSISPLPFNPTEYKIYEISKESQQGGLFSSAKTFYVVFYIDGDSIKRISGSSDDTKNLIRYKISDDNRSKLIKTKSGIYYDEWELYLPRN